jgi:hypothetical protein
VTLRLRSAVACSLPLPRRRDARCKSYVTFDELNLPSGDVMELDDLVFVEEMEVRGRQARVKLWSLPVGVKTTVA